MRRFDPVTKRYREIMTGEVARIERELTRVEDARQSMERARHRREAAREAARRRFVRQRRLDTLMETIALWTAAVTVTVGAGWMLGRLL